VEIDHLTIPVRRYEASKQFYARLLAPLGFVVSLDWPDRRRAYLGLPGEPSSLWLCESEASGGLELSLAAEDPGAVEDFHSAAVSAGARTKDEPGIRTEYSREYYAARVLDPDGNSIEAVFRGDASASARRSALAA
jgi:catechol 2,3-dioxygenase-like lactoylglutathione lyase family enzyme